MHTTTWSEYRSTLHQGHQASSNLYTMNENPAVEWNKLEQTNTEDQSNSTGVSTPLVSRVDLSLIIAPAIVFKPGTMVCASAAEVNCTTDLELSVNLDQIKLVSTLMNRLSSLTSGPGSLVSSPEVDSPEVEDHHEIDSGVDFESANSTNFTALTSGGDTGLLSPYELSVNCGKISLSLYEVEEHQKRPLVYVMVNQPNLYVNQQRHHQKVQLSCFNFGLLIGSRDYEVSNNLPKESDYKVCLIETKSGEPHPDTGIPPSFLVLKCETGQSNKNSPQFNVDMGRPTKFHLSVSRLDDVNFIKDKVITYLLLLIRTNLFTKRFIK